VIPIDKTRGICGRCMSLITVPNMMEGNSGSCDVTVGEAWFDQYNTEGNFDMDACFNAFDKDG
jgi:hypothetical protein